jgi:putative DNA primase/helicase
MTAEEDAKDNIIRLAEFQEDGELPPYVEDSMALIFAARHAHELRYVSEWARWLSYDGGRWAYDTTLHTFDRARAICRGIALDCSEKPATAIASAKTVAAIERLARADRRLAATVEQWDANDLLIIDNEEDC